MANTPIRMLQIKKLLRLLEESRSERSISKQLGLSRTTIRLYQQKFRSSSLSYAQLVELSDADFATLAYGELTPATKSSRQASFDALTDYFSMELKRVGVTRLLLWNEYIKQEPSGYSYSQFCLRLNRLKGEDSRVLTMHFDHVAGDQLQVDFAGKKLSYFDPEGGVEVQCPVLICVLPFSGQTYVEALANASQQNLYESLSRALRYFGGVPKNVLSDNMKQYVDKACRYEPKFNEMAEQWSVYYNTNLSAARVRKPKDKPSHVRNSVKSIHIFWRIPTF
jgi:transposase